MMNHWVDIIKRSKDAIAKILICIDDEIVSEGSGAIIDTEGTVCTAKHVLDEYINNKDEMEKHKIKLKVYSTAINGLHDYQEAAVDYKIIMPATSVTHEKELPADLALIQPHLSTIKATSFLKPLFDYDRIITDGEDVLICGYSEETPVFMDIIPMMKSGITKNINKNIEMFNLHTMRQPEFKHGIVSSCYGIYMGYPKLHYDILHVDASSHKGMSGGPIFDCYGNFIAIINERFQIKAKVMVEGGEIIDFYIPSGTTKATTTQIIRFIYENSTQVPNMENK